MGSKAHAVRLTDEVSAWIEEYAAARGVDGSTVLRTAIESFREDCERGVPELREQAARQSSVTLEALQGVGDCPKRPGELGHIWEKPSVDPLRHCVHCGLQGRGKTPEGEPPSHFEAATADRTLLYARLRAPDSAHGRVKK